MGELIKFKNITFWYFFEITKLISLIYVILFVVVLSFEIKYDFSNNNFLIIFIFILL